MEKVKEVIAKVTHKDGHAHDSTVAHEHTTGTHTTGGGLTGSHNTTGAHSSNLTGSHQAGHVGQPSVTDKLNPMVDSDRDGKTNLGLAKEGPGAHNTHNTHGDNFGTGATSHTTGTHGTHTGQPSLVQKLNPMVDSDGDGKSNFGLAKEGPGAHNNHNNHTTGTGLTGNTGYSGSTNAGPHSSNIANAIDPRVDSDQSNYGQNSGLTGGNHGGLSSTHGQTGGLTGSSHQPLTDTHTQGQQEFGHQGGVGHQQQGLGGVAGNQTHGHLDGPAPNTAGTHKSDMLNKLDPRIDSDRDGSKTVGSNQQTY